MSQKTGMAKQNSEQNEPSVQLHGTGSDPDYSYTKLHNTEILTRKVDLCFFSQVKRAKIVTFYTEILTRKVVLWCFS